MNVYAISCLWALCGCARIFPETREVLIDHHGVSSRTLVIAAGTDVRFVNRDRQPHHIHSEDCAELSSRILYPYDAHTAQLGDRPKVCHFQDLLTSVAAGYSGTVEVRDDPEKRAPGTSQ